MLEDTFFKKAKVRCWVLASAPTASPDPVSIKQTPRWPAAAPFYSSLVQLVAVLLTLQAQGYVARSAYKLLEIQQKHKLIPPGGQVRHRAQQAAPAGCGWRHSLPRQQGCWGSSG